MTETQELPEDYKACENCKYYDKYHYYCIKDEDEPVIFEPYETCDDWEEID